MDPDSKAEFLGHHNMLTRKFLQLRSGGMIAQICFSVIWLLTQPGLRAQSSEPGVETGYVISGDGIRLYYTKIGSGTNAVIIIPGRLFMFQDFQKLAKG